jgi:drug/metabolite transporter (DMT)-like permease
VAVDFILHPSSFILFSLMRHHLMLLLAFLLWSTSGPLLRLSGLGVADYIAASSTVGLAALLALFGRRVFRALSSVPRGPLLRVAVVGAFNIWAAFAAFRLTTIGNVLVLHYTAPLLVALVEPAVLGERLSRRSIPILGISIVGLLLFGYDELAFGGGRDLLGLGLAAASAVAYAAVIIYSRDLARLGADPLALTVGPSAFLWLCVLPFVRPSSFEPMGLAIAGGAGLMHLSIAAMIYMIALRHLRASTAAIMGYLEIVFGLGWGLLFFGETVGAAKLFGAALIAGAGVGLILEARAAGGEPALTTPPGI